MFVTLGRDDRTPVRPPHPRARPSAAAPPAAGSPDDAAAAAAEQRAFNQMLQERAELERETNAINELIVQQAKKDDELMRAWIKLI